MERTMTWQKRDHYELLEIERDASPEELKRAQRLQLQAWHPDKFPASFKEAAVERTAAINRAFSELSNPALRKQYDALLVPEDEEVRPFPEDIQNVPRVWKRMASWMREEDAGSSWNRRMAFTAGDLLERRRTPSERQLPHMLDAWKVAVDEGFDPYAEEDDE